MRRITDDYLAEIAALDLSSMTASEIDEHWEPLMYEGQVAEARAKQYEKLAAEAKRESSRHSYAQAAQEHYERAQVLTDAQEQFYAEWKRRNGWARVFLVLNHDGHYHRERNCPTCFPTTQFGWVPALSDKPEDEVIEVVGHMACTVCWPAAPTHPKFVSTLREAQAQAAAKTAAECEGSGRYASNIEWYATPRGTCAVCDRGVTVTKTGKARRHKTREQEKADAQAKEAAKLAAKPGALDRLHAAALRVDKAIGLLDAEHAEHAISSAWLHEEINDATRDTLVGMARQKRPARA